MQQPHIIPYAEVWKAGVERLCARIWGTERCQYRYGGYMEWGGTKEPASYVALLGDEVLGFCSIWRNEFHPMALYFTLAVQPSWERRGIGGRLLEQVACRKPAHLHLQTSLWDMSIAGRSFLSKQGFQEIRRTYETSFDVASAPGLDRWDDSLARDGAAMIPYNRLGADERQAMALLSRQCYANTHTVNPLGEIDVTRWGELIESDLMAEGSFAVMKNHEVIAYALMHPREAGAAELGWRGVCAGEREHTRRWIVELTKRQVRYAQQLGLERLYAEIDTTDVWALPMLYFFPFEPVPAWVTYQR
ncbi:GNAT family N-acetyltransferase [Paenibacillus dendritiformis]|uniref:GNAT family N-acetyltransferase n=1 Tax=Paenibacillus dendritiformis TaxID=130049 RepID=UPI00365734FF